MTDESFDIILLGECHQGNNLFDCLRNDLAEKQLWVLSRAERQITSASTEMSCSSDDLRMKDAGTCWWESNNRTQPISNHVAPAGQTFWMWYYNRVNQLQWDKQRGKGNIQKKQKGK